MSQPTQAPRNLEVRLSLRQIVGLLVGLLAAALAAGVTSVVLSAGWQSPIQLAPQEAAEVDGLRLTHLGIERHPSLVDAAGEPVEPPAGAVAVVVRYRIELLESAAEPPVYCPVELADPARRWPPDLHWLGRAELDDAAGCGGTADQRLTMVHPVTAATVFVVPVNAGELQAEVTVGEQRIRLTERTPRD